jgi:hypothetical protein
VPTLEEIVFQVGRDALADQDSVLHGFSWAAPAALLLGLIVAAVLLSNWKLRFVVDAPDFYAGLDGTSAIQSGAPAACWSESGWAPAPSRCCTSPPADSGSASRSPAR